MDVAKPVSRRELIEAADEITERVEAANLAEDFSTELGQLVNKFEWLIHFEGHPQTPKGPPETGAEAHARVMDAMSYVLLGEVVFEGHVRLDGVSDI